jgi:hypothetical protein
MRNQTRAILTFVVLAIAAPLSAAEIIVPSIPGLEVTKEETVAIPGAD